jgi:16S rRNA (cytidine1402-2'-O)-methyltransferase
VSQPISTSEVQPGTLYCVATPIGNLKDISFRAVETLQNVDVILAEDTRHSGKLLNHYNIQTKMRPLHDHNERQISERIVDDLLGGASLALISDAGTPLVSDPGFVLVRACVEADIPVVSIPGACAAITALVGAAFPMNHFTFIGFLPAKGQVRTQALEDLKDRHETLVFYESGRRLEDFLSQVIALYSPDRQVVLAHELTKTYEQYYRGTAQDLLGDLKDQKISIKGEWVVCVAGLALDAFKVEDDLLRDTILKLLPHLTVKDIVEMLVNLTGQKKKIIYNLAISMKESI